MKEKTNNKAIILIISLFTISVLITLLKGA